MAGDLDIGGDRTLTGPLVVAPDRLDAGAKVLDGESTEAVLLYLRTAGAHEGVEMPPEMHSGVAATVDAAATVLLRLSDGFHGLANYLKLRADGARRIDTDELSDDVFAYLLEYGPSLRLLRVQEPLGVQRRDYEGLEKSLKVVELKADLPGHGAEGTRTFITRLERRLDATSDAAERARLTRRLTSARRTLTAFEQAAKGAKAYGGPAQVIGAAAEIADGENPAKVAGKAWWTGLAGRLGARMAPGATRGVGGMAAGLAAGLAAEAGFDALDPTPEEQEYRSTDELLDEIDRDLDGLRRRHSPPEALG